MLYEHLSDTCLAARIGEGGLSDEALARALEAAGRSLAGLRRARAEGGLALLDLPSRSDDLAACRPVAEAYRERFAEVVVLGTGGSSLGGQALAALAGGGSAAGGPRLHFLDNVDPRTFEALLVGLDPARTGILAISKSGGTAETLAQLLALLPALERAGADDLAGRVTVITGAATSPLRRLAERRGFACLDHEPGVGGRFSVLSNVGALPAMIAGLDAAALRAGAGAVLDQALAAEDPAAAPPALGAALAVSLLGERRTAQSVLMPYVDRLAVFARWYRQLWAESLGKDGTGTTPIAALGAVDQHSQLQLYLAGPRDKMFTLIRLETAGQGPRIDPGPDDDEALAYLRGRTLGDLLDAMARATAETLARHGRPTRVIRLARLDEAVLGALFMHFMLETMIAADLLGVNAFDQPAVEESKVLARRYLAGEIHGGTP
jgi:glucose-6-phosphate isomerase